MMGAIEWLLWGLMAACVLWFLYVVVKGFRTVVEGEDGVGNSNSVISMCSLAIGYMTTTSIVMLLFMNTMIILDWGQTRDIATRKTEDYKWSGGTIFGGKPVYKEVGPARIIIGEYPTVGDVNRFFVSSLIVNNGIYFLLPIRYNYIYAVCMGIYQVYVVFNNHKVGIKIKF
jgi:hypothetical protein